jgi:dTDP-4-dehydrorhamnose reductase
MTIVITGASGYLGQHLAEHLRAAHDVVLAYGSLPAFASEWQSKTRVTIVQADLTTPGAVAALVAATAPTAVVHLAAISSPVACDADPDHARAINCPLEVIDAVSNVPDCRLVFLSTDQVYEGTTDRDRLYLEMDPTVPVNSYGRSKLAFEQAAMAGM